MKRLGILVLKLTPIKRTDSSLAFWEGGYRHMDGMVSNDEGFSAGVGVYGWEQDNGCIPRGQNSMSRTPQERSK